MYHKIHKLVIKFIDIHIKDIFIINSKYIQVKTNLIITYVIILNKDQNRIILHTRRMLYANILLIRGGSYTCKIHPPTRVLLYADVIEKKFVRRLHFDFYKNPSMPFLRVRVIYHRTNHSVVEVG